MVYDSAKDTKEHIREISKLMDRIIRVLEIKKQRHDASKLGEAEKPAFDKYMPLMGGVTYGSKEYKEILEKLGAALKHHYRHNRHHPEHFKNGIDGMTLMDIMEMFCDWKASTLRHKDGNFSRSIELQKEKLDINGQLYTILKNTQEYLEW